MIVVLVILAILAAMMVPALLGWIDEARNKQYVLEARSVYMAAQAIADEVYAADPEGTLELSDLNNQNAYNKMLRMADLAAFPDAAGTDDSSSVWLKGLQIAGATADSKDAFKITGMYFTFTSSNTKKATVVLKDSVWSVYVDGESTEGSNPLGTASTTVFYS